MTLSEYVVGIWSAVRGIRLTQQAQDQKLSDAAGVLSDVVARVKLLQISSGDILAAEGSIGAELHEIAVEQVSQRGLVIQILEAVTPAPGSESQQAFLEENRQCSTLPP